jgi:hypothetical protein
MKIYYKIVEHSKPPPDHKDVFKTLYHGVNGTRILKQEQWLKANIKNVADGSIHRDTNYLSGWHVFADKEQANKYLYRFKNIQNKVIVPILVKNIRPKEHSKASVYLAEYMYILTPQQKSIIQQYKVLRKGIRIKFHSQNK